MGRNLKACFLIQAHCWRPDFLTIIYLSNFQHIFKFGGFSILFSTKRTETGQRSLLCLLRNFPFDRNLPELEGRDQLWVWFWWVQVSDGHRCSSNSIWESFFSEIFKFWPKRWSHLSLHVNMKVGGGRLFLRNSFSTYLLWGWNLMLTYHCLCGWHI